MTRMTGSNLTQLNRVDLSANSRNTLAVLIKLLIPHVPYSIHVIGAILNSGPRTNTLQDVDPSKVALWSTIPLNPDAISTANPPALFSIVAFSHLNHQFSVFCSTDSSTTTDPPTEVEKTHIKHVFEYIRDMARAARPIYDSVLFPCGSTAAEHPPMIVVGAVHAKWTEALASMSLVQSPNVRYAFTREALRWQRGDASNLTETPVGTVEEMEMVVSEIRASDLPFVHGASTVPRTDAYLLSRAPYSACFRIGSGETGSPQAVACALMHADGSIGALRVDADHQRRGFGMRVLLALVEKLNFSQANSGVSSDDYQDLGGGALGWYWMDAGTHNNVGNRFFRSVFGEEGGRPCHWTYIQID